MRGHRNTSTSDGGGQIVFTSYQIGVDLLPGETLS